MWVTSTTNTGFLHAMSFIDDTYRILVVGGLVMG